MKGKKGEEAGTTGGAARGVRTKAVRDYLTANPDASPKEVVASLAAQGIDVKVGLVSVIKYSKKSGGKKTPGRKLGRPAAASKAARPSAAVGAGVTLDTLIDAKQLVDKLGGLDQTISLLNKLAQLR